MAGRIPIQEVLPPSAAQYRMTLRGRDTKKSVFPVVIFYTLMGYTLNIHKDRFLVTVGNNSFLYPLSILDWVRKSSCTRWREDWIHSDGNRRDPRWAHLDPSSHQYLPLSSQRRGLSGERGLNQLKRQRIASLTWIISSTGIRGIEFRALGGGAHHLWHLKIENPPFNWEWMSIPGSSLSCDLVRLNVTRKRRRIMSNMIPQDLIIR